MISFMGLLEPSASHFLNDLKTLIDDYYRILYRDLSEGLDLLQRDKYHDEFVLTELQKKKNELAENGALPDHVPLKPT